MRPRKRNPGGKDPFADVDSGLRARLRAGQLDFRARAYEEGNEDIFEALGNLPYDQFLDLRSATAKAQKGARAIKGGGLTETLGFLRDLDLSSVAPLRESAGLSKGQLMNRVLREVTNISDSEKTLLKGLLYLKSFNKGGKIVQGRHQ